MTHLKLIGLTKITDEPVTRFCCRNRGLETLEICKCKGITIACIENIIKTLFCLKRIKINRIPKIKLSTIKETLASKPNLQVFQFGLRNVSMRDNGLRVPLPPKPKKKKKKKIK